MTDAPIRTGMSTAFGRPSWINMTPGAISDAPPSISSRSLDILPRSTSGALSERVLIDGCRAAAPHSR